MSENTWQIPDKLKLQIALDTARETNSRLNRRVQAMEAKHPERSHLWGSDQTLRLEIVRLHKELIAAHKGAYTNSWIIWKRNSDKLAKDDDAQACKEWVEKYGEHLLFGSRTVDTEAKRELQSLLARTKKQE